MGYPLWYICTKGGSPLEQALKMELGLVCQRAPIGAPGSYVRQV